MKKVTVFDEKKSMTNAFEGYKLPENRYIILRDIIVF
jgi:hypothetical protein